MTKRTDAIATTGGAPPATGLVTSFTLQREWAMLPGCVLTLRLRMYLSGEIAARRENTIGLTTEERPTALQEMRLLILSDTIEEISGFPDFPEEVEVAQGQPPSTELKDRAYKYFSQRDAQGRLIFGLFVEDIITEYWRRALPSPYFPAATDSSATS